MSLIDSGWAAWLPDVLLEGLAALTGGSTARRAFRNRLAAAPDAAVLDRWERFRLVAPSRLDVPADPATLDGVGVYELLDGLGLVAGQPPQPVAPEPVELVLQLDHDDLRELERIRSARATDGATTPVADLPPLDVAFADVGRNDPCPCGSARKFKRCHGA